MKVLVRAIPDDYRGSLDCIQFVSPVKVILLEDNNGDGDLFAVICDGVFVAELREWLGKDGMRGCSGHEIVARPDHEIVWLENYDEWED